MLFCCVVSTPALVALVCWRSGFLIRAAWRTWRHGCGCERCGLQELERTGAKGPRARSSACMCRVEAVWQVCGLNIPVRRERQEEMQMQQAGNWTGQESAWHALALLLSRGASRALQANSSQAASTAAAVATACATATAQSRSRPLPSWLTMDWPVGLQQSRALRCCSPCHILPLHCKSSRHCSHALTGRVSSTLAGSLC